MLKKTVYLVLLLLVFSLQFVNAQTTGAIELSGELSGAPYRIRVPANWNGTLFIYAHGYRDLADHAGEVDNRVADSCAERGSRTCSARAGLRACRFSLPK